MCVHAFMLMCVCVCVCLVCCVAVRSCLDCRQRQRDRGGKAQETLPNGAVVCKVGEIYYLTDLTPHGTYLTSSSLIM